MYKIYMFHRSICSQSCFKEHHSLQAHG